jgi:hypothetical protein
MPVQPQLFPDLPPAATGQGPHAPAPPQPVDPAVAPVWLQRLSLVILVVFCVYLGVIVTALPWLPSVWDHNLFLTSHVHLWNVLRTGAARGVISGLGLLDVWIGISEAIHYHDQRAQTRIPS